LKPNQKETTMPRTKEYKRVESPAGRARCAIHAVSELLSWEWPANAPDDWTPTTAQIIAKTRQLYGWVRIDEAEATAALEHVLARRTAAA
jgi:hypothetical protein